MNNAHQEINPGCILKQSTESHPGPQWAHLFLWKRLFDFMSLYPFLTWILNVLPFLTLHSFLVALINSILMYSCASLNHTGSQLLPRKYQAPSTNKATLDRYYLHRDVTKRTVILKSLTFWLIYYVSICLSLTHTIDLIN